MSEAPGGMGRHRGFMTLNPCPGTLESVSFGGDKSKAVLLPP